MRNRTARVPCTASTCILSDALAMHSAIYVRTSALGYVLTARIDKCRRGTKFFLSGKCSWALRGGFQPQRPGNVITRSSKSDADVQNSTAKWVHDRTCLGCMSFSKGGEAMPVLWIDAGCA
jgi:hypothetical protein